MNELMNNNGKMTSLEISEITGKPHGDLLKAIRKMEESWVKIGRGNFSLTSYINSQNKAMPMYELTKTECLYIATKFNDEARAKLVIRWEELELEKQKPMSTLDMVQASIDAIRANEQQLKEVKDDIKELKAKTNIRPDYFTIVGYGTLQGVSVGLKMASSLGRKASKICKEREIETEEIPDPRFGKVKTYPQDVLKEVFAQPIN